MVTRLLAALVAGLAIAGSASAQYPTRPIKIVPNSAAGTGPDIISRLVAAKLTEYLGQSVVVENRPGSNGNIAGEHVAKSPADGYTLMMGTDAQFAINPHVYSNMSFDWNKDLVPVASIATEVFKLVVIPAIPANTVAEFIAYARSVKAPLFYGSAGNGSQHHLAMELLKERTGINLSHVPYKGGGSAVTTAMLAGEVSATIGGSAVDVQVRAGKLRALGVTGPKRVARYPDLPTIGDTVPGFEMVTWYGLFAPTGTPQQAMARLRTEMGKVLALPDTKAKINEGGPEVWIVTPEEFAAVIRSDYEKNGKLVKALGVKLD
jgi:tripartite-type tricarboxylate transporter receptor subunit TctC